MLCLQHTRTKQWCLLISFFKNWKSNSCDITHLSGAQYSARQCCVAWLTEHEVLWLKSNSSDVVSTSQFLCLLQGMCLCAYEKHTRTKYHTIILNHSCSFHTQLNILTHCKLSWMCARLQQSTSLTFFYELLNHLSRDLKRVTRLFPDFLFFRSLRIT